jgi:hypothetical protein
LAIQGSLEEAPLPDVIQLLSLGRKTGCLTLVEREMEGEICLEEGRICHAAVFGRRDRLGDMLVRTGRITQDALESAVAVQRAGGKRVSLALLESGQVERDELEQFVRRQVEEAVYYMFTWRTGSFAFTTTAQGKHQEVPVSIDPEGLLLEGARRVDEWSLIEKRIPSLDLVFRLDRARLDATKPALTREQNQIIPLIDGTRDIHGLIEITGMAEFTVGKALFGLITAGFAQRVERRSSMRHLDYREMLAYVVREAEFADPEERRAAARHIADCATCTQRLKTIHVRRTGAAPVATPAAAVDRVASAGAGAAAATLVPDGLERRVGDRRSGPERREIERRRGERRVARSVDWERPGRERRSGRDRRSDPRRIAERRIGTAGDWQLVGAARAIPVPQRSRAAERRTTGPRRVHTPDAGPDAPERDTGEIRLQPIHEALEAIPTAAPETDRRGQPAAPAAPSAAAEATIKVTPRKPRAAPPPPPAEPTVEVTPQHAPTARRSRPDPEIPEPPDELPAEVVLDAPASEEGAADAGLPPASVAPDSGAEPPRRPARTTDIEWVVSPKEANNLLRTSRIGLAGVATDQPPTAQRPAARQATTAPVDTEPAKEPTAREAAEQSVARRHAERPVTRKPAERRRAAKPSRAVREVTSPPPQPAVPRPTPVPAPAHPAFAKPAHRRRRGPWLALAAALAVLAGGVWIARPFLGRIGAAPQSSAPPAAAVEPTAEPPVTTASQSGQAAQPAAPAPAVAEPETPGARTPVQPPTVPAATPPAAAPPPARVPAVGVVRGAVRDARSGAALAGVHVTVPGTALTATTDAAGAFALVDVPAGRIAVAAALDGRVPERRELVLEPGATAQLDFALAEPPPPPAAAPPPARPAIAPVAREADEELSVGGWTVTEAAAAAAHLGNGIATIPDLWIESIAVSESGSRPRVRVALLTPSGERIVLTETRSGAPALGAPRVTALRVIPASEAYPLTTGTVSFGSLLVTAKTSLAGDALRALLAKLAALE